MLPTGNGDRLPLHRMTSKPKPTKSSHYVHGILKGLSALLATDAASKLAKDTRSSIAKVGAHMHPSLCIQGLCQAGCTQRKCEAALTEGRLAHSA